MNALYRLLAYARPYRFRLAGALTAMIVLAAASFTLTTLVKPIFDSVLPARQRLGSTIGAILVGCLALAGNPEVAAFAVGCAVVWALLLRRRRESPRTATRLAATLLAGVMLAAPVLAPFVAHLPAAQLGGGRRDSPAVLRIATAPSVICQDRKELRLAYYPAAQSETLRCLLSTSGH